MVTTIDHATYKALAARISDAVGEPLTRPEFVNFSRRMRAKDDCVVVTEGGPIQMLYIIEDEDAERPTLRLDDILIVEGRRGAGIGTAIITAVKEFCAEEGFDLNLSANPLEECGDPARPAAMERLICYYERLGFTPERRRCDGNMIIEAGGPDLEM